MTILEFLGGILLFLFGLRLSAFFSGSETGFYRISPLRLSIDAHAGDPAAKRLLWYSQNPGFFVATVLVGNNVANYLTTVAVGLVTAALLTSQSETVEVISTLCVSPVVFICGELLPKHVYYRAPLALLRKDIRVFHLFYYLFFAVSLPLVAITRAFERFGASGSRTLELVLGRKRLVHVLNQGHEQGLLTDVQSRVVHGVLHTAGEKVRHSVTPTNRILGLAESATRAELLDYARRFGLTNIVLHRSGQFDSWFGYVRVVDLGISRRPLSALTQPMPRIAAHSSKLEALVALRTAGAAFGLVVDGEETVGIVNERGLIEQLMRPVGRTPARPLALVDEDFE